MTAATATVRTITAEVRVLMVGSRQVTLSVYRQLDTVDPDDIEPFGRVSDSKDGSGVYVIGRHRETGVLVRSGCRPRRQQLGAPDIDEFREYLDRDLDAANRIYAGLYAEWEQRGKVGRAPSIYGKTDMWYRECWEDTPEYLVWSALPLIVLAGLK